MSTPKLLSHASPIWPVTDMQRSLDFYENQLGFTINFKWEDPPTYATLSRDEIGLHLTIRDDMPSDYKPLTSLFIFVHDVDAIWEECLQNNVKIITQIGDRDYRMRDFDIEDPDGYRIVFGKGLDL